MIGHSGHWCSLQLPLQSRSSNRFGFATFRTIWRLYGSSNKYNLRRTNSWNRSFSWKRTSRRQVVVQPRAIFVFTYSSLPIQDSSVTERDQAVLCGLITVFATARSTVCVLTDTTQRAPNDANWKICHAEKPATTSEDLKIAFEPCRG